MDLTSSHEDPYQEFPKKYSENYNFGFHLSCVHRPFPGDLAINYFDVGINSTPNRQTGNGRWGAVCGSGLAASALCVNIIYAPLQ